MIEIGREGKSKGGTFLGRLGKNLKEIQERIQILWLSSGADGRKILKMDIESSVDNLMIEVNNCRKYYHKVKVAIEKVFFDKRKQKYLRELELIYWGNVVVNDKNKFLKVLNDTPLSAGRIVDEKLAQVRGL